MAGQDYSHPRVSDDARAMMMFEANKKSLILAYVLWWFLGWAGAHRFYAGHIGTGVTQLLLCIIGSALTVIYVGFIFLFIWGVWWLIDAFLIPGWIREQNAMLAAHLGGL